MMIMMDVPQWLPPVLFVLGMLSGYHLCLASKGNRNDSQGHNQP